ncbi:MAG: hypothetical protein WD266_02880 [Balneolales bacterium]
MKQAMVLLALFSFTDLFAQEASPGKTRFVLGLSGPELFHAGLTHRIGDFSQFGFSAGAGPSWGMIWTSINLEHRLYLGKPSEKSNQKTYFFRQGSTFFPSATESSRHFTVNLTVGKDFLFSKIRNGLTVDVGVFYLPDTEEASIMLIRSVNLAPALRFQFYFSL